MIKTYKYRLYPNKKQKRLLQETLNECRWLYNYILSFKIKIYNSDKISLSQYDLNKLLPILKNKYPRLKQVHSQVLQDINNRIDLAFKHFFRRIKLSEDTGFPRFKGFDRYDSFTFKQSGFQLQSDNKLQLSKIGKVKIKKHRKIGGNIKTLTIHKNNCDQWFACFNIEVDNNILPKNNKKIGIDLGIEKFATLSDETIIENPKYMNKKLKQLQKQQRRYDKVKNKRNEKSKKDKSKQKHRLSKLHLKIKNQRSDFLHKASRTIVNSYGFVVMEDLNIEQMQQDNYRILNRYIGDASWGQFLQMISYKAEEAGRIFMKVDPKNTSNKCSRCGYITEKKLSDRIHKCPQCQLEIGRDFNASLNILGLGLQSLRQAAKLPVPLEAPLIYCGE